MNRKGRLTIILLVATFGFLIALAFWEARFSSFPKEKPVGGHFFFTALFLSPVIALLSSAATIRYLFELKKPDLWDVIFISIGACPLLCVLIVIFQNFT